jgi:hypothetical protein
MGSLSTVTSVSFKRQYLISGEPEKHLFAIKLREHIGTVHKTVDISNLAMDLFHRQLNRSEEILPLVHPLLITCLDSVLRIQTKTNQKSNNNALFSKHLHKLNKTLGNHNPLIPRVIVMVASLLELHF